VRPDKVGRSYGREASSSPIPKCSCSTHVADQRITTTTDEIARAAEPQARRASSAKPQVIPEGAGPVKSVGRPFFRSLDRPGSAPMRRRGQGSGGARPRSGRQGLEAVTFRDTLFGCRGVRLGSPRGVAGGGGRGSHQGRCLPVGAGRVAARSSLRRVIGREVADRAA